MVILLQFGQNSGIHAGNIDRKRPTGLLQEGYAHRAHAHAALISGRVLGVGTLTFRLFFVAAPKSKRTVECQCACKVSKKDTK